MDSLGRESPERDQHLWRYPNGINIGVINFGDGVASPKLITPIFVFNRIAPDLLLHGEEHSCTDTVAISFAPTTTRPHYNTRTR